MQAGWTPIPPWEHVSPDLQSFRGCFSTSFHPLEVIHRGEGWWHVPLEAEGMRSTQYVVAVSYFVAAALALNSSAVSLSQSPFGPDQISKMQKHHTAITDPSSALSFPVIQSVRFQTWAKWLGYVFNIPKWTRLLGSPCIPQFLPATGPSWLAYPALHWAALP